MTKERKEETLEIVEVSEGVEVTYHSGDGKEELVAALDQPWIGDEGPMEAEFRQVFEPSSLRPRGLAFDPGTTVYWDEDAVMRVRKAALRAGEIAFCTPVLVRDRFPSLEGHQLFRIDVLKEGALRASRYVWQPTEKESSHA